MSKLEIAGFSTANESNNENQNRIITSTLTARKTGRLNQSDLSESSDRSTTNESAEIAASIHLAKVLTRDDKKYLKELLMIRKIVKPKTKTIKTSANKRKKPHSEESAVRETEESAIPEDSTSLPADSVLPSDDTSLEQNTE